MISLNSYNLDVFFRSLEEAFWTHLQELGQFNFSLFNPVFWLFFAILFLILLKLWNPAKSFSFCFITAAILLALPKLEEIIAGAVSKYGGNFEFLFLRAGIFFLIAVIFIYYVFIRGDS